MNTLMKMSFAVIAIAMMPGCSGGGSNADDNNAVNDGCSASRIPAQNNPGVTNPLVTNPLFSDVSAAAGFGYVVECKAKSPKLIGEQQLIAGGVAIGDVNGDGWDDIYIAHGGSGRNRLFINQTDGTFAEDTRSPAIALDDKPTTGPLLFDSDGDGALDLFVGGINATTASLFLNDNNGRFSDITANSGLASLTDSFSASSGDYNNDGLPDLYISHWLTNGSGGYLWKNKGGNQYEDVSSDAGIAAVTMNAFAANFADINADGWSDLLVAADFETSQVFINQQDGTFDNTTNATISDENGMGAAVADYDNDGDLDWFVTSIYDPNGIPEGTWGVSGNRLYNNQGDGTYTDVTDSANVRDGGWGWASCFADVNNDGYLDIFHVNGFEMPTDHRASEYYADKSRLFMANGDGRFSENAVSLGISDAGQGRGVACFDYDQDGDIDILVANNQAAPTLFRNNLLSNNLNGGSNYLSVKLVGELPNRFAIGAKATVSCGTSQQIRVVNAGSNFSSQNSYLLHFGVADCDTVDSVVVRWPDSTETRIDSVAVNQLLVINK